MHKKYVSQSLRLTVWCSSEESQVGKLLGDVVPPWDSEDPDLRAREQEGHPWAAAGRRIKTKVGGVRIVISACSHTERNGKSQDLKGNIVSSGSQDQEWEIKSEHSGHKGYIDPCEATGSTLSVPATINKRKPEAIPRFLLQERKKNAYCA